MGKKKFKKKINSCFANGKDDWQSRSQPELPQLKLKKIAATAGKRKSSRKVKRREKMQNAKKKIQKV